MMLLAVTVLLASSAAWSQVPLFAAECPAGITVDSNDVGQVRVNRRVAKLTTRPDGQITAQHAGVSVDITPQGSKPPRVTSNAKDKASGPCEIVSFKAPRN